MLTFISLAILGILILLLGVMKQKRILLPLIIAGLLITLGVTMSYWNSGREFYSRMLVFDNTAVAFICVLVLSTFLPVLFRSAGLPYLFAAILLGGVLLAAAGKAGAEEGPTLRLYRLLSLYLGLLLAASAVDALVRGPA